MKGYFILGYPGEQPEDLAATTAHVQRLWELSDRLPGRFRASVFEFRPYPGSPVWDKLVADGSRPGRDDRVRRRRPDRPRRGRGDAAARRVRVLRRHPVRRHAPGRSCAPPWRSSPGSSTTATPPAVAQCTGPRPGRFITLDGPGWRGEVHHSRRPGAAARRPRASRSTPPPSRPAPRWAGSCASSADDYHGAALACLVVGRPARPPGPRGRYRGWTPGSAWSVTATWRPHSSYRRLDGVPKQYLLDLNAGVRMPDLAVVLTADPHAHRGAGSHERGATHRFNRDAGFPARETALYEEAVPSPARHGRAGPRDRQRPRRAGGGRRADRRPPRSAGSVGSLGNPRSAPTQGATPHVTEETWTTIERLVKWLDEKDNATPERARLLRLLKLSGGGRRGRAGGDGRHRARTRARATRHTWEDVQHELCDVILSSMVALATLTPDAEQGIPGAAGRRGRAVAGLSATGVGHAPRPAPTHPARRPADGRSRRLPAGAESPTRPISTARMARPRTRRATRTWHSCTR